MTTRKRVISTEGVKAGVEANGRLTALTGAVLLVLLAAMGLTVFDVRRFLPEHFLLGFLLIPPLGLKVASTGYRFFRYYTGAFSYRQAGPPPLPIRLLGPIVVLTTAALFVTGLELWWFGLRFGSAWVGFHKLSFTIWLPAIGLHVLWHLGRTARTAREELESNRAVGELSRRGLVIGSLVAGVALAIATLSYQSPFIFFHESG